MSLLHQNLQAFVAIVETSTVHGAAKKIRLTQTGVTQRIRSLESSLSVTLFTRSRKGMLLTPEGQSVYQYCQKALELEGETISQIDPTKCNQEIRIDITAPSSIMRSKIIPSSSSILERYPNIIMTYKVSDNHSGVANLKSGASQLAVIHRHEVALEFDSKMLPAEEYILVAPASWRKIPLKKIIQNKRIIDFDNSDEFTFNYLKKFNLINLVHKERHYVNNTDALTSLIIAGQGYSVLAKSFAKPFIDTGAIVDINKGNILKIEFALAWYPRALMPKYLQEIIDSI